MVIVLETMARQAQTSARSVYGLLKHHGRDVAGALQLLPPGESPTDIERNSIDEVRERLSDADVEDLLEKTLSRYHGRSVFSANDDEFKFSIAGAQPKIALTADADGKFLPPDKRFATTH